MRENDNPANLQYLTNSTVIRESNLECKFRQMCVK